MNTLNPIAYLAFATLFLLLSTASSGQTIIPGGDVSGTWTVSGSPYLVQDNITIPDGQSLILEPGVLVEFQGHYSLSVQGRILAEGTNSDTIVFTVNDTTGFYDPNSEAGGWASIRFIDTPLENDSSILNFCRLEYGKAVGDVWHLNAGGALCLINFGKVRVSHCLFDHNSAGGAETEVPAGGAIHVAWSNIKLFKNTFSNNHAHTGGAIQMHESGPLFEGNLFLKNTAETGGAVACGGPVELSFLGDQFIGNKASSHGGGLMCWTSNSADFQDVLFSGNSADWGGGLGIFGTSTAISGCIFEKNTATSIGGGMAADYCELDITGSVFVEDSSANISGALHNWHCETQITQCEFTENVAFAGGAIYSDFSTAYVSQTLFLQNRAENGGALRYWCSNLALEEVLMMLNHANNESGALEFQVDTNEFSESYNLTLSNSQFLGNDAGFRFGGVKILQSNSEEPLMDVLIDRCEFRGNEAERIGALNINGNIHGAIISNSIFEGNSSTSIYGCSSFAGGVTGRAVNTLFIYNEAGGGTAGAVGISNMSTFDFIHCTFAGNTSPMGGAISMRRSCSSTLINDIFWGNSPYQLVMNALTDSTPCQLQIYHCNLQDGQDSIRVLDTIISVVHWGSGNMDTEPGFEDILNENFELSDQSHCLGQGIDTIQIGGIWYYAPVLDMDGNPRPDPPGSNPDLGILESPLAGPLGINDHDPGYSGLFTRVLPNPFSSRTRVDFTLPNKEMVSISLYNSAGEKILEEAERHYPRGNHSIMLDGSNMKAGLYYVRITAGSLSEVQKVMLTR